MSLVTVADVKSFGQIDHTAFDSIIEDILIPSAESWLESYLDCKLSLQTITTEKASAFGYHIWPDVKPIVSLVAATAVYDNWSEIYVDDILYTDRYIYIEDEAEFAPGDHRYTLSYIGGYTSSTVPAGIKLAELLLINRSLSNKDAKSRQAANGFGCNWDTLEKTDIIGLIENETFKGVLD
jgi:hypothetical protein